MPKRPPRRPRRVVVAVELETTATLVELRQTLREQLPHVLTLVGLWGRVLRVQADAVRGR